MSLSYLVKHQYRKTMENVKQALLSVINHTVV